MNVPRASRLIALVFTSFILATFSTGCAHLRKASDKSDSAHAQDGESSSIADILNENPGDPEKHGVISMQENGDIVFRGIHLKNTHFDYPITINSRVEYWVDYFCGKGRRYFDKYLERSEFFIPYIKPLLKQNHMPQDLVYLSMIESGFNNMAKSRAKAVGPWQFMAFTGKRYGLAVDWWLDDRRDIRKSTLAAIQYLRELYNMFGSWELAAAGYNAGEAKVARGIQRYGTRDFWALARHRFLRPETRDYVPKIIAAAIIDKNREQFGFSLPKLHPAADETIAPSGELVKVIKSDKPVRPASEEGTELRDAVDGSLSSTDVAEEEADASDIDSDEPETPLMRPTHTPTPQAELHVDGDQENVARAIPTPHMTKDGEVSGEQLMDFEVESPADLLKIATAAGLSYQTVKGLNPEILRWCTPPTHKSYLIKLPASVKDHFLANYNRADFRRQADFLVYTARGGDTLSRIASKFGIKVDPVVELNRMSARVPLRKGAKIILPLPIDRSRSLASLEVKDAPEKRRKSRGKKRKSSSAYHTRRLNSQARAAAAASTR